MWSENGTGRDTTSLSSYRLHFTSSQLFLWLCPVPSVSVTLTLHLVPSVLRSCVVRPTGLRSATLRSVKDRRERTGEDSGGMRKELDHKPSIVSRSSGYRFHVPFVTHVPFIFLSVHLRPSGRSPTGCTEDERRWT